MLNRSPSNSPVECRWANKQLMSKILKIDEEHGVKVLNFVLFLVFCKHFMPGARDSNLIVRKMWDKPQIITQHFLFDAIMSIFYHWIIFRISIEVNFFTCAKDGNKILFLNNRSLCKSLAIFFFLITLAYFR